MRPILGLRGVRGVRGLRRTACVWGAAMAAVGGAGAGETGLAWGGEIDFRFTGTIDTATGIRPAPWDAVAPGMSLTVLYTIRTDAPDLLPGLLDAGRYAITDVRVQVGDGGAVVDEAPGGPNTVVAYDQFPDRYLVDMDLEPNHPGVSTARAAVDLIAGSAATFFSDAQPTTIHFAAFDVRRMFRADFNTVSGMRGTVLGTVTGFSSLPRTPTTVDLRVPGTFTATRTPTMVWGPDPAPLPPDPYTVQIDDTPDFSSPVYERAGITGTSLVLPEGALPGLGVYYWRVVVSPDRRLAAGSPSTFALVPRCPADFNVSGAASVQDIFDFLAAYFAGCP